MLEATNEPIKVIGLPEGIRGAETGFVDETARNAFPALDRIGEGFAVAEGEEHVDVIGHDGVAPEVVALAVEVMQAVGDDLSETWITQGAGAVRGVEVFVELVGELAVVASFGDVVPRWRIRSEEGVAGEKPVIEEFTRQRIVEAKNFDAGGWSIFCLTPFPSSLANILRSSAKRSAESCRSIWCKVVWLGAVDPSLANRRHSPESETMIAAPTIKTPQGELAVEIEFGRPIDANRLRGWRVAKDHPLSNAMQDALEFGKLAGKRWRYYLKREEAALSLDELVRGIANQPQAEIGFLLVAKPTWKPAPKTLGIAWCRRTWCNHIVLDFLAAHPSTLGKDYAGIGTALLYSIARVAGRIKAPLVWGEATALSAPFYRRVLDEGDILDHFFIPEDTLEKMRQRLNLRTKPSKP